MIATGELTLSEFLDTIKPFLNTTIESKHKQKFLLTEKLKEEAYIHLIKKPIIIYVRQETLASNNATLSLGLIVDKIIDIEKIETLLFLSSLGDSKPEDEKIHWIAFEINIEDAKSKWLERALVLDQMIKRPSKEDRNNTVGRLDYKRLDEIVLGGVGGNWINKYSNGEKRFYENCFSLSLTEDKIPYVYSGHKYFDEIYAIVKPLYNKSKVYAYACQICSERINISLHDNTLKNDEYTHPKEFITIEQVHDEWQAKTNCKHNSKINENRALRISLPNEPKTLKEWNQIFLYFFYGISENEEEIEACLKKVENSK